MPKKRNSISDLKGAGRLAIDAVNGVVDIVEAIHANIVSLGGLLGKNKNQHTSGITGMVYKNIRTITRLAGTGFDKLLEKLPAIVEEKEPTPEQEAILSALNGVIGDHLEKTNNSLAIQMQLRSKGKPLTSTDEIFNNNLQQKILLLIHGSCMNDLQWNRKGHDHGISLEKDLGYRPIYLHYNSGKHISENGKELSNYLEAFFSEFPGKIELVILAHSMGGLVARSAIHYGNLKNYTWLNHLTKIVFLGTPHHGAPLEQTGNWIDKMLASNAYSTPLSKLGKIRSAGITDLRYGNIIDEDWSSHDRFESHGDRRIPVPLPTMVKCYTIAATISDVSSSIGDDLIGDGLVPLYSALGKHRKQEFALLFDADHQRVFRNLQHLDLLNDHEVYISTKEWLGSN